LAVPCSGGLEEVTVTASPTIGGTVGWSDNPTGPPILAEDDLFAIQQSRTNSTLEEIAPNGTVLRQRSIGPATNHFESPAAGDGILVAAGSSTVYAIRPTAG
jgi:hypothetical protein